jgi:alpha-L-fucosidase
MNSHGRLLRILLLVLLLAPTVLAQSESTAAHDARMAWWRDARFGLFLHWGLYAVPAGEWGGKTEYGEWIRTSAHIPLTTYDSLVHRFNPTRFDARAWVRLAKEAGMKYIVITSKHHDGFCLFDSQFTDFDVMFTPFHRDILRELSDACRAEGLKMCWYHSIMDWHHPDYLPRRDWENDRPVTGAVFARYVAHLKNQLRELITHYGPIGVLWFDGEWESTWNDSLGRDLYHYVRSLQPDIIINNRVGAGRSGMEGFTEAGEFGGDFGTPEQQIPATGLPGVDWETCMTMNDHWGYNSHDQNWKSSTELIRMLADIASKGGNFLLNVGPTAEGVFPPASIERLKVLGSWMHMNGEAIYGTSASPFRELPWGRCTQKPLVDGTKLFLHVFSWPGDGRLIIPGIGNVPRKAYLMGGEPLASARKENGIEVRLPNVCPDTTNTVIVVEIEGKPDIYNPPTISAGPGFFVDTVTVAISTERKGVEIHYTTDGSLPTEHSPLSTGTLQLKKTTTLTAACFRGTKSVSPSVQMTIRRVPPHPATEVKEAALGLTSSYFEGDWDIIPDFGKMNPQRVVVQESVALPLQRRPEHYGVRFEGFVNVPADGVYTFGVASDDGSLLRVDDSLVVNNDELHGMTERVGSIALARGAHKLDLRFFQKGGGEGLNAWVTGGGLQRRQLTGELLSHSRH